METVNIHRLGLISSAQTRSFITIIRVLLITVISVCPVLVQAADIVTAIKSCPGGPPASTTTASFTLATAQVIEWTATYNPVTGCNGDAFFLSTVGPNMAEIPLTTTGEIHGFQPLSTGTYHISINNGLMGQGSYTVIYNQTASISVSPTNHQFAAELTGDVSSPFTFTISSTGDVPVTISSITSSNPAHFEIVGTPPIGLEVPPSKTFQVRFNAGPTPGLFGANITVSGTNSLGAGSVADVTVSVSGTTEERKPKISCSGTPNIGTADCFLGKLFCEVKILSRSFQNIGTDDLLISSITLVNDSPFKASFSLFGTPSTAPLAPGGSRLVSIRFAAFKIGGPVYSGHLVIESNDLEPTKLCYFQATTQVPRVSMPPAFKGKKPQ